MDMDVWIAVHPDNAAKMSKVMQCFGSRLHPCRRRSFKIRAKWFGLACRRYGWRS
jgi:hypothetical protein